MAICLLSLCLSAKESAFLAFSKDLSYSEELKNTLEESINLVISLSTPFFSLFNSWPKEKDKLKINENIKNIFLVVGIISNPNLGLTK
ncbi:hypothetical protein [Bizionia sp. M204]|uniref:hypothetical protein n=1 Tax=Bizionia sp. M204 TaxID=2675331 RepID=UPI00204ACBE1|nr:hypothetical protein [Bizionia sp. M204]UPS92045.1 hypothetical protein GMA17_10065 [Bizionia sp. M204]